MLQRFSPIDINAIALFPFVFSKGLMGNVVRNHEAIHFQQQLETGVIGFYIIYALNFVWLRLAGITGAVAYKNLKAEKEAYENELNMNYLAERERWEWIRG
tara:strand:+ start:730 stop:1032 length:303 start_codon:yes stop_codon:yes gene_type:complete